MARPQSDPVLRPLGQVTETPPSAAPAGKVTALTPTALRARPLGQRFRGVVTLSATYGAGGSLIGPKLAHRLGVPFYDRALPLQVAERLSVPLDDILPHDWEGATWKTEPWTRWVSQLAMLPPLEGVDASLWHNWSTTSSPRAFREQMDAVLHQIADRGGAVILGRAAAVVLANHPRAFHVRLTGPLPARLRLAMRRHGLAEGEARRQQVLVDRARESYVRALYRRDPNDLSLYHLVVDTTRLPLNRVVTLIALAAQAALAHPSLRASRG